MSEQGVQTKSILILHLHPIIEKWHKFEILGKRNEKSGKHIPSATKGDTLKDEEYINVS